MSATNATLYCEAGSAAPGPQGDCTPEQHRSLQNQVNSECKVGKRACNRLQDCMILLENLAKNQRCADARGSINNTCFRGGDEAHRRALTDALNAAANCSKIIDEQCKPKKDPLPQPVLVPVADEDFLTKMSKLTGLTGAALVLYLIVSEGSRLFPPRNLVPVP